ncbi:glycosyltransferase [Candidatus Uhrbacteria bacterium]|nr:glycosyltransferase [Candidatus Uhrbacteria bacterium]
MSPKISVIIPAFNHGDELEKGLASLKKQTFQDFEIIIVDDGSVTPIKNANIRFEHNLGAPKARNAGFDQSKGEYVIFLDADAELVPNALETMLAELESHPKASFAYPSFFWGLKRFPSREFDAEALKQENYIHTSALIRREAFPRFDESLKKFQDWDLFLTMSEQGKTGHFINKSLYTIAPRKSGMSQWLPSFVYDLPWNQIGWAPKSVKKFQTAREIIRKKHGLSIPAKAGIQTYHWLAIIATAELASFFAVHDPIMSSIICVLIGLCLVWLGYQKPELGIATIFIEHLIGSKGRLFVLGADVSMDGGVSVRILMVAGFVLGWLGGIWIRKEKPDWKTWLQTRTAWIFVAVILAYGLFRGLILKQPFIVPDANSWGILILCAPALHLAKQKAFWSEIQTAATVGLIWLFVQTLVLYALFSHGVDSLYYWLRKSGIGEITELKEGVGVYRIFIQSQIYAVMLAVAAASKRITSNTFIWIAIAFAVILVSFSRSFWIGTALGIFISLVIVFRRKIGILGQSVKLSGAIAVGILIVVMLTPWAGLLDIFSARATASDPASSSRWELLEALKGKIGEQPILGHGFGATVTYQSKDPRIVQATGGTYTTYAFEWGWLDFWVKFGILGIPIMLWVIFSLAYRLHRSGLYSWIPALAALAAIHIFTPYLNHPLGLVLLILMEAQIETPPFGKAG